MKKLILLAILTMFISACSYVPSYQNVKDTVTFKNRYAEVGVSIPRGIQIDFIDGLPKDKLVSGEAFDVAGIIINHMPPSAGNLEVPVSIKLTSSEAGKMPKTNFETLEKSLAVESAITDESETKVVEPGLKIVSSDFELLDETAFKLGTFFYNLDYSKDIDLILDYTYPVSAIFSNPLCLRKPYAPGVNCPVKETISEADLGLFAKTIPITIEKFEKNILPTTNPDQIKLELTFYIKDKGVSGLSSVNDNALVELQLASLAGYKDLRDVVCSTQDGSKGNSRITFKLDKGSAIVSCFTLFNMEEDAMDFHLKMSLAYTYNTRLVKTLKIETLPKPKNSNVE